MSSSRRLLTIIDFSYRTKSNRQVSLLELSLGLENPRIQWRFRLMESRNRGSDRTF